MDPLAPLLREPPDFTEVALDAPLGVTFGRPRSEPEYWLCVEVRLPADLDPDTDPDAALLALFDPPLLTLLLPALEAVAVVFARSLPHGSHAPEYGLQYDTSLGSRLWWSSPVKNTASFPSSLPAPLTSPWSPRYREVSHCVNLE